ncbi:uncharacterized protein TNCV_137321 [Trichonephila clavipes]|nr:uncharacterized protein TNCV_137321 [Trichonephila clavipes]
MALDKALCSPDLAPSDSQLFWYLKHSLCWKRFRDDEEGKAAVNPWLSDQVDDFFEEGFQNLVLMYNKCINKLRNYAEK